MPNLDQQLFRRCQQIIILCFFDPSTTICTKEIQWMAPSNNGGMPISGYKVQRANHDNYFFGTVQCLQADNSYLTTLPENQHSCTLVDGFMWFHRFFFNHSFNINFNHRNAMMRSPMTIIHINSITISMYYIYYTYIICRYFFRLFSEPGMDDTAFLCFERKCKYRVLAINGVEDDNFADVSPYLVATAANLPVPPASVTRDDPPSSKTAIEVMWTPVTSESDTGGAAAHRNDPHIIHISSPYHPHIYPHIYIYSWWFFEKTHQLLGIKSK